MLIRGLDFCVRLPWLHYSPRATQASWGGGGRAALQNMQFLDLLRAPPLRNLDSPLKKPPRGLSPLTAAIPINSLIKAHQSAQIEPETAFSPSPRGGAAQRRGQVSRTTSGQEPASNEEAKETIKPNCTRRDRGGLTCTIHSGRLKVTLGQMLHAKLQHQQSATTRPFSPNPAVH